MEPECIFCQIVKGISPSHKVWEDDKHLAFLSIFPNTEGVTVVIPKEHYDSYVFNVPEDVMLGLMRSIKEVAAILDAKLDDVGRTAIVFEGFGVNHLHAKLFPMHGTKSNTWIKRSSNVDKYFQKYEGYISSHDYRRAEDSVLETLAQKLRG